MKKTTNWYELKQTPAAWVRTELVVFVAVFFIPVTENTGALSEAHTRRG